jgi:hypothetical protein
LSPPPPPFILSRPPPHVLTNTSYNFDLYVWIREVGTLMEDVVLVPAMNPYAVILF